MRGEHTAGMLAIVAGVVLLGGGAGFGAVPVMEDLSGCRLPNGLVILPAAGSELSKGRGDLVKLSSGTLATMTVTDGGKALAPAEVLEKVKTSQQGDLQYMRDAGGTFWAPSGRIQDLGTRYLSEAAAMTLTRPMAIPATSRGPAGMHPDLAEGHVYLVEGTDGKFALVRLLEKVDEGVALQYVYQSSGAPEFTVPEGDRVAYHRSVVAAAVIRSQVNGAGGATTQPGASGSAAAGGGGSSEVGGGASPRPAAGGGGSTDTTAWTGPRAEPTSRGIASVGGTAMPGSVMGVAPQAAAPVPAVSTPAAATPQPTPVVPKGLGPRDIVEPGRIVLRDPQNALGAASPTASGIDPAVESNLRQREQMIQGRMAIVSQPARLPAEVAKKAQAANELAALHADESADLLVRQVTFLNVRSSGREFSPEMLHPCFAALKKLGKPASAAAMKGLKEVDVDGTGEGIDSPWYRAGLLAQVVRAVEGEDVATFMLKSEAEKSTEAKQRAMFEHLMGKE